MSGNEIKGTYPLNRRGFTLIELLVVISIISMLMSIMLPGLNRAREMGRRVVCLSDMRSLSLAWMFYAHENDDAICDAGTDRNDGFAADGRDYHWVADGPDDPLNSIGGTAEAIKRGVLYRYLETTEVYKCKSDTSELVRSYSISNTMNGHNCGCGTMPTPFTGLSQIPAPSERMVFVDADSIEPQWSERKWLMGGFKPTDDTELENAQWDTFYLPSNNVTARHGDGYNLSFADIHVGHRSIKDELTLSIAGWDFSCNETADRNVDLEYFLEVMEGP